MRIAMIGAFGLSPRMTMSARALPLARAMAARGHQVRVVMPPWHTPEQGGRRWQEQGVELEYVPLTPRIPGLSAAAISWRLLARALDHRPDVVHIFKPKAFAGLAGWLLWHARRLGLAHAHLVIDEDDWEGPGGWNEALPYPRAARALFAWQERWGLRHADAVTVASRALQGLAWGLGVLPERVRHLPNGPRAWPAGHGAVVRARHGLGDAPVILLYTRFFEYDVACLVETFRRIHADLPSARLLVVGQGLVPEDEEAFARQVAQAGLEASVTRVGWVPESDLPDHFAAADLALYPFADTLINRTKCPVKLVDLLYSGVPVVADAVGEIREYIRHGETGLLTPPAQPGRMAEAALTLLRDPARRSALAERAATEMRTTYAWETLADSLLGTYETSVRERPSALTAAHDQAPSSALRSLSRRGGEGGPRSAPAPTSERRYTMQPYARPTAEERLRLLEPPQGRQPIVLDTDTYNEIDDQFALVYALLSPEVDLQAVYAAPFHNDRSTGPGDGMEKSYQEILRILSFMGRDPAGLAFRGSTAWLPAPGEPVRSAAVDDLIAKARQERQGPLYVLTIGAITNVASALLLAPDIAARIVVVWLGGNPTYWPDTREFNLRQDPLAARVVLGCGVPLVMLPCALVTEQLRTTLPEMERYVKGKGVVGDYLYGIYEAYIEDHYARSKVIWDISSVAYMVNPAWLPSELHPSPVLLDDITWGPEDATRHPVRIVRHVNRDGVFGDLFRKLASAQPTD